MEVRQFAEPRRGIRDVLNGGAPLGEHVVHRPLEDRHEQVVLALEIEIDGPCGHARHPRDVGDLGLEVAVLREDLGCCAQD